MMINYVLGFMFSHDLKRVALIKKTKPEWQAGKLNGIGGKVEKEDLDISNAMNREFMEETGYSQHSWQKYASLTDHYHYKVDVFLTLGNVDQLRTTTEEKVMVIEVAQLENYEYVPNLKWLIPLALTILEGTYCYVEANQ